MTVDDNDVAAADVTPELAALIEAGSAVLIAAKPGIDQLRGRPLVIAATEDDEEDARVPADARLCLKMLAAQLIVVKQQILENDRRVRASARSTDIGRRLMEIPPIEWLADPTTFRDLPKA